MFPMKEIFASGMTPTESRLMGHFIRNRLIKEMVFVFKKEQSIGIIHPAFGWGKMNHRPSGKHIGLYHFCN